MPARLKPVLSTRALHPGNFAMVMASGIISIGAEALNFSLIAEVLFWYALLAWLALVVLSTIRLWLHSDAVRIDLLNPRMVFSYFTLVAATDVLGLLLHARGFVPWAMGCWVFAFLSWCALLYLAFSVLTFLSHPHNVNIVHGGWLIAIVGTQSLVLLGARIAPDLGEYSNYMMMEVHLLWGLGNCLYGIFVTLFCYRTFFLALKPEDISPLLCVIMGAAAISANAGSALITAESLPLFLMAQKPFIDGVTLMIWSWATWWIPLVLLFGIWKHGVHKRSLEYEPIIWSLVFPLGMYTVASLRLGEVADFEPLVWIGQLMIWVALLAWVCSFWGLVRRLLNLRPAKEIKVGA